MVALPPHNPDSPFLPDSERILRSHGAWQREWDERDLARQEPPEFAEQVRFAIQCYGRGLSRLETGWELAERFGRACRIGAVQKAAERAIQALQDEPADLKRAQIAFMRRKAIQGALRDGAWGPAMAGLARAGDVVGELEAGAALGSEDLRLVVEVEGGLALPDTESDQTGMLPDTNSDQGETGPDTDSDQE